MSLLHQNHIELNVFAPFRKFNKELREFYVFIALQGFAISLIGIFEPIYIFLFFGNSFFYTFLYFGILYASLALLAPLGVRLVSKIGIKHTMLLSIPFSFLYYTGLWQINNLGQFVLGLAVISGISKAVYWPAFHLFFSRITEHGSRGRQISYQMIILSVVASIAPFIGGIIIVTLGFVPLFFIVLSLFFASFIPLFLSQDIKENFRASYVFVLKHFFTKKYYSKIVPLFSEGGEFILNAFIWPIFLFLLAINFDTLGLLTSASLLVGMIFSFYIGKATDRVGSDKLLVGGSVLNALLWPVKMFVRTPWEAFLAHSLHRFGLFAVHIPFGSIFYDWAGESDAERERFILLREVFANLFKAALLFSFAFLVSDIKHLMYLFLLGSLFSFGYIFAVKRPGALLKEVIFYKNK